MRHTIHLLFVLILAACGVGGEPERPVTSRQLEVGADNSIQVDTKLGKSGGKYGVSVGF